jgi:hypothetical protein
VVRLRVGWSQWRNRLPEKEAGFVLAQRKQEREERTWEESALPTSYYLDESDPDILILRRQDDTFVAAFSARGATREGIVEAAKEDYYRTLLARTPADEEGDFKGS